MLLGTLGAVLVLVLWEGYKAMGRATDDQIGSFKLPAHTDDLSMPHTWTILSRFGDPELRGSSRTVGQVILEGMWFTFRVAMVGFVVGVVVGLLLAILMQRFHLAERSLLPYVILSQTVPLVALAPLVVGWGGQLEVFGHQWEPWMSVTVISAYLAFFPVAVGALRGLQSPSAASVELMDSYAASHWQALRTMRLPASVPYLILSRVILIPVIAGLAYELIRFAARNMDRRWVQIAMIPGLSLQKLTTREPTLDQIEVAIAALRAVFTSEQSAEVDARVAA